MEPQTKELNVEQLVADIESNVPEKIEVVDEQGQKKVIALRPIYKTVVLSGMRLMFDKQSHGLFLAELEKPEPMPNKIANGIIGLIYMLWQESNQSLPPQIIVPVSVVLTLRVYDEFLIKSGDPDVTEEVLGEALALVTTGVMAKFGVTEDQLPGMVKGEQPAAKPGLIDAQIGGQNG